MTYIEGSDYFVRTVPFPTSRVGAFVLLNDDATYSIYLNALVDEYRRRKALRHELEHIERGDFWNDLPIEDIESI